ncbi:MAG: hypothetical protein H8E25_10625 [Planctomycetes bacterium]|nr:hypothetical protein [Planctomycetota bacterium]
MSSPFPFSLRLALAAALFSSTAFAQADYYVGDTLELPTFSSQDADHAVIAVNQYGDVVIANHSSIGAHTKQVEVNVLAPLGATGAAGFKLFSPLLVGDPSLDILQFGTDSCAKPDIEALSDDSFLVVWSRHESAQRVPSRLEVCRIVTRDGNGALLAQPTYISPQPGEGFVIDSSSNAGQAGFMPDIAAFGDSHPSMAYVVFAHETLNQVRPTNTYREYDIRCIKVDWMATVQTPTIGNVLTLDTEIAMDNINTFPYSGGLVLPDAVIDDGDNLVVAYEEYLVEPHLGQLGSNKGSIKLQRYSYSPFSLLNEVELSGYYASRHQRRPMIASSPADSENKIIIGWNETDNDSSIIHRSHFKSITFNSNSAGFSSPVSLPWDESFGIEDDLVTVAMSGLTELLVSSRRFTNKFELTSSFKQTASPDQLMNISTRVNYPWRPAVSLFDFSSFSVCFTSFEGAATHNPNLYKIYLTIQKLQ